MAFFLTLARRGLNVAMMVAMVAVLTPAGVRAAEFEAEPLGQIAELPSPNPEHWVVIHDIAFNHMREGKLLATVVRHVLLNTFGLVEDIVTDVLTWCGRYLKGRRTIERCHLYRYARN